MTREELEQELSIAASENDLLHKQIYELQHALELARGAASLVVDAAEKAGVALSIPNTPEEVESQQLEARRAALDEDSQAINELRSPQSVPSKPETALDIVRSNQRERAELVDRVRQLSAIVSRVAASVGISQWDADGSEILKAVGLAVLASHRAPPGPPKNRTRP